MSIADVEIRVNQSCAACEGSGRYGDDGEAICAECNGVGFVTYPVGAEIVDALSACATKGELHAKLLDIAAEREAEEIAERRRSPELADLLSFEAALLRSVALGMRRSILRRRPCDALRAIGGDIVRRRAALGLSQAALARKAGLYAPQLCHVERGHYAAGPVVLEKIAGALGCHLADLLASGKAVAQ